MRLRYLYLPKLPPLEEISVRFGYEFVLGRACALHFVVGVNGSGKTRLLRAIAEIFLSIERKRAIPFPVTLVYDLEPDAGKVFSEPIEQEDDAQRLARHTIFLHQPQGSKLRLIDLDYVPPDEHEAERDWDILASCDLDNFSVEGYQKRIHYVDNSVPDIYLPSVLLAYTSGATSEWEELFAPTRTDAQDIMLTSFGRLDRDQERPPMWDRFQEETALERRPNMVPAPEQDEMQEAETREGLSVSYEDTQSIALFVPPHAIKLAICAVTLHQAIDDFDKMTKDAPDVSVEDQEDLFRRAINQVMYAKQRMKGLRGILNEIDWLWPVTFGLHIALHPERLNTVQTRQLIRLYEAATSVVGEPDTGFSLTDNRHLYYDLRAMTQGEEGESLNTAQALMQALTPLGDDKATPYSIFKQLLLLQQQGILLDVTIALRKRTLDDVILYDWLSDGERVFLGRMAFFHLLQGTEDALILLDEPETHFNDYWKRELVDIIDESLRDDSVEVLLTTHSSIALTDAFDTEIVLLSKDTIDGSVTVEPTPMKSFGSTPTDIMRTIFHAPTSVGQRAAEFLDLMLMVARYQEEIQAVWNLDQAITEQNRTGTTDGALRDLQAQRAAAFERLRAQVVQRIPRALRQSEDPDEQIKILLPKMVYSVHRYTQQVTGNSTVTLADALEVLHQRLGPGYYDFEFRRLLRGLGRDADASSY